MEIQSLRCATPCCSSVEEHQTQCSRITRIAMASLGAIAVLAGIFALLGAPGLNTLGPIGSSALIGMGSLMLLLSFGLKCVSKKSNATSSNTSNGQTVQNQNLNIGKKEKVDQPEVEHEQKSVVEKQKAEKALIMSFDLKSHVTTAASCSQYHIDDLAPVKLVLFGSNSYCYLKAIQNPQLKEILSKVGAEFERSKNNVFFNFSHTFTPTEKNESSKENDDQVSEIFEFINTEVHAQTGSKLTLDLDDMTQLTVEKAEYRSRKQTYRAYEMGIRLSEKTVETAKKSGLVFREYYTSPPEGTIVYAMGVGQTSFAN